MKYFTLIIALFSFLSTFSQSDKEFVLETVKKNVIEGHIYFLADDLLKGRETGSPENKIAASYLANTLRGYGVKPISATNSYFQEVLLKKISPPTLFELAINGSPSKNKVILKSDRQLNDIDTNRFEIEKMPIKGKSNSIITLMDIENAPILGAKCIFKRNDDTIQTIRSDFDG